ncbi:hypothetical protein HELRODRAFT_170888 [Helobdella robusta]|uniref:Uncharacterized protein n=1 Tax=Helobdella robusta TaxID=6412 RepID=T1F3K1_HELRO|nr:hypothetical protein HELRODRAFT_170888 [Helobdella robusta]ESO06862.1 hypothetical protein HELRODRAFT_170888 [Helobdella robusta]
MDKHVLRNIFENIMKERCSHNEWKNNCLKTKELFTGLSSNNTNFFGEFIENYMNNKNKDAENISKQNFNLYKPTGFVWKKNDPNNSFSAFNLFKQREDYWHGKQRVVEKRLKKLEKIIKSSPSISLKQSDKNSKRHKIKKAESDSPNLELKNLYAKKSGKKKRKRRTSSRQKVDLNKSRNERSQSRENKSDRFESSTQTSPKGMSKKWHSTLKVREWCVSSKFDASKLSASSYMKAVDQIFNDKNEQRKMFVPYQHPPRPPVEKFDDSVNFARRLNAGKG